MASVAYLQAVTKTRLAYIGSIDAQNTPFYARPQSGPPLSRYGPRPIGTGAGHKFLAVCKTVFAKLLGTPQGKSHDPAGNSLSFAELFAKKPAPLNVEKTPACLGAVLAGAPKEAKRGPSPTSEKRGHKRRFKARKTERMNSCPTCPRYGPLSPLEQAIYLHVLPAVGVCPFLPSMASTWHRSVLDRRFFPHTAQQVDYPP